MKKSLLALAAAAALAGTTLASTAASAAVVYDKDGTMLNVYGRVQAVYYSKYWNNVKSDDGSDSKGSINASAQFNIDARTRLTDGIDAFGRMEYDAADGNNIKDSDGSFLAKYLWVGLDFGQYGIVKIGKFEEAIKYALQPTDFYEDAACVGQAGNDDKRESVVQYQWSGYGVDAILSYAFAKNNEHIDGTYLVDSENVDMDYSISAALGYTTPDLGFGPVGVRAGYHYGKLADAKTHARNTIGYGRDLSDLEAAGLGDLYGCAYDDYKQFAISAFWGSLALGPYAAIMYHQRKFSTEWLDDTNNSSGPDTTITGFEFSLAYTFANGVKLATGYNNQKYEIDSDSEHGIEGTSVKASTIPLMAMWKINPNFLVWSEARFDVGTDDDEDNVLNHFEGLTHVGKNNDKTVFSAGIRYMF